MPDELKHLTPETLAQRWGLARKTIMNMSYDGRLPFAVRIGSKWRYPVRAVEAWERKNTVRRR